MDSARLGQRARSELAGSLFARVEWVAETGSTNTDLLARAAAGEPEGAVLVAEHQTAGKGTRGRTWVDTPGAQLMVSVLVRPSLPAARLGRLTMAWSVAAAEACRAVAGVEVRLKWPNDLYDRQGDRKLAGVLAESHIAPDGEVRAVVIGMGMNVNGGVPEDLPIPAVSLGELAGRDVDRVALLVGLLRRFEQRYRGVESAELLDAYRAWSATLGRQVRIVLPHGSSTGIARDVTGEGHLLVEVDGQLQELAAADVVHLR